MSSQSSPTLLDLKGSLPPPVFRARLRQTLLARPDLKLKQVAHALGVTRQAVGQMVGRLDRSPCAGFNRAAPKREKAAKALAELEKRVSTGVSLTQATQDLGISRSQVMRLGFRVKAVRPTHGTAARAAQGCNCWRCRRVAGITVPRGTRQSSARRTTQVLDWLAWTDPDTGEPLAQARVGYLTGMRQSAVSRIARAAQGVQ